MYPLGLISLIRILVRQHSFLQAGGLALGFLGDIISGIFDGDENAPFGQRMGARDAAFQELYRHTYFDFGLTPPRNVRENQVVPMAVSTWGTKILRFEIHGNILSPHTFLSSGWQSPFHMLARETNLIVKGRVWAFDTSRLHTGILSASAVHPGDVAHVQSEEYLKVLRTIGLAPIGHLRSTPYVELSFGEIWRQYSIPDRIFVAIQAGSPLSDAQLQRVIQLILHTYNRSDAPPVTADYSMNVIDGTVTLTMRETIAQPTATPPHPTAQPTPPRQQTQPPAPPKDPDDGFPYDFYRGLGLIDEDNKVWLPSSVGDWLRIPYDMWEPQAKAWLLSYKPE